MCDPRILEVIKADARKGVRQMTPRGGAPAASQASAHDLRPIGRGDIFDLTHELHEDFPTYIGLRQFSRRQQLTYAESGVNIDTLRLTEHVGTHIDAPLHFAEDGQSVSEISLDKLVAPLCIVDIRGKAAAEPDAAMSLSDIEAWTALHGPIPVGACVAMLSGWGDLVATDRFRNADERGTLHFPGVHPEAATYLLAETEAVGLAVDTLSLDRGVATDFPTHRIWLPGGCWGLESVANLDRLPASGSTIVVGAPKHRGGSGGPARVLAFD